MVATGKDKIKREKHERSARSRSSLVVVTSAETVTLLFLASATSNNRRARGLGWLVARALYVNWDLEDMMAGLAGGGEDSRCDRRQEIESGRKLGVSQGGDHVQLGTGAMLVANCFLSHAPKSDVHFKSKKSIVIVSVAKPKLFYLVAPQRTGVSATHDECLRIRGVIRPRLAVKLVEELEHLIRDICSLHHASFHLVYTLMISCPPAGH